MAALKRSAGVGAVTLGVVLATCAEALGHGGDGGALGAQDQHADRARAGRSHDASSSPALVARRGFGTTGRKTAPSSSE